METRARYVLVGLFTLLGLLAGLGFILWLAKVQLDRTYSQYDILFDSVAGLGQASAVSYNGVNVGQVLSIDLDTEDPALVRVRIEIDANTPVRSDTVARLESQVVTGVSFVALEGGRADSEPLVAGLSAEVPVIASRPSLVQGLMTDAPDLLSEAILLMRDIRAFTAQDTRDAIA
jgi:phospholipid/cholesterol/gamma-HCH transport system substrate-binding protein